MEELHTSQLTVTDACAILLDVVVLCPFPLAVACTVGSAADIAPEFVFRFLKFIVWVGLPCMISMRSSPRSKRLKNPAL